MIWIFAGLLTALVLVILLRPLFRAAEAQGIAPKEVYKAQLAEIEREAVSGLISDGDADAARAEIARRVLRAEAADTDKGATPNTGRWSQAIVVGGFVVLIALGIYLSLGRPDLPGQPFAQRDLAAERAAAVGPAVQELERRFAEIEDPADRALFLGDAYASIGGIDEAETAYRDALGLRPGDPDILIRLGEVEVVRGEGLVTTAALGWVEQALAVAPDHPAANFYRALYDHQQGNHTAAATRLAAMLAGAPPEASWTEDVTNLLAEVRFSTGQAEAVADMSEEDREIMIRGMVQQLATRLEEDPDDFDGWLRLANSYAVLGELEAAESALFRARALAEGEPVLEQRVQDVAESLSLP